jgi:NAD-dependent SIR2 family protein deacetylase
MFGLIINTFNVSVGNNLFYSVENTFRLEYIIHKPHLLYNWQREILHTENSVKYVNTHNIF